MATFIEISSEDEQCLELAKLISKAQKIKEQPDESFLEQCSSLAAAKEISPLLEKIINEFDSLFSAGAPDKEIENFTFVLLAVMKKLGGSSQDNLCLKFVNKVASNPSERTNQRLRLLNHIYTVMGEDSPILYHIILVAIQLATKSKQPEALLTLPHFKDFAEIEKHIKEWQIDVNQQRQLFKSIRDFFKKTNRSKEAHKWTTKYLGTFKAEEAAQSAEEGLEAALDAIRLPDLFQFDGLLDLVPVKQLEKSHPKVFQLLNIFVSESLDTFFTFINANPTCLESLGLNKEDCITKMRYLSLATLCAANTKVSYTLIGKTLQIDQSEVENWVVSAMSEEILDAKLDQLKGIVIINRSLQRVFTMNQWKQLRERLNVWTTNIEMLLKIMQEARITQHQMEQAPAQLQQTV